MNKIFLFTLLVLLSILQSCDSTPDPVMNPKPQPGKIAIALHGGAGNLKKLNLTPQEEEAFKAVMDSAIQVGYALLQQGASSVDAVEATIHVLEDSPLFNAGKGAVFNHEGINEMDAAIMNGSDLSCGAVSGLRHVRNPISAARLVMDKSEHVFLSGKGAEEFVVHQGMELVDSSYFFTQHRWDQLQEALEEDEVKLDHDGKKSSYLPDEPREGKFGTVGCVALDKYGNIAAGTSTGGLTNKRYGRIGDSPLIGSGTYANNASCAVSCTGKGEDFIRNTIAADIAARIEYADEPIDSAVHHAIHTKLTASKGRGGCIAINTEGQIAMAFTTTGMYRASIDTLGKKDIAIYK